MPALDLYIIPLLQDGKSEGEMTNLDKLLKKLTCTQYTFAELQVRPLPEGVDPLKIESYLIDSEFQVNGCIQM